MLLQFGVPGGPELLIMLLVMMMLFGVPLLLVVGGGYLWFRSREDSKERVEQLEAEVAQLRRELEAADVTDGTATDGVDSGERTDDS